MYSNETYEVIKERILSNINININKDEGSFLNNMISPLSIELTKAYIEFEHLLGIMFASNTYGNWLDMKVAEFGMERKQGEVAKGLVTFRGSKNTYIPAETLIKTESNLLYKTINEAIITDAEVTVLCEAVEVGSIYNIQATLINLLETEIRGIEEVINNEDFSGGIDRETDEELRERFFIKVKTPAISGNERHYKEWAMSINGVKNAKVESLWNGPGTVKLIISGKNNRPVPEEVIEECKSYIETVRPIGATVSIITPTLIEVDVQAELIVFDGYNLENINESIEKKLETYITESLDYLIYNKIGAIIAAEEGVIDYRNLRVNNSTNNIIIESNAVASLRTVNLTLGGN